MPELTPLAFSTKFQVVKDSMAGSVLSSPLEEMLATSLQLFIHKDCSISFCG
jgi:hypothetical protein